GRRQGRGDQAHGDQAPAGEGAPHHAAQRGSVLAAGEEGVRRRDHLPEDMVSAPKGFGRGPLRSGRRISIFTGFFSSSTHASYFRFSSSPSIAVAAAL